MKPTRWLSSSSSSSKKTIKLGQSKKTEATKQQRTVAVESVVKKYMQIHPGVFPKLKQVHDEVGGSWYILKNILTELKEKLLPVLQIQDQITTAKPQALQIQDQITTAKPQVTFRTIFDFLDSLEMEKNLDSAKIDDPGCRVQSSEVITNSEAIEVTEELDGAKLVKPYNVGDQKIELHSSTVAGHDGDQKEASQQLSCLMSQIMSKEEEATQDLSHLRFAKFSKLTLDGNGELPHFGNQPLELHSSTVVGHDGDQKEASKQLSCLMSQIVSKEEEATQASGVSLDSNVAKFGKVPLVGIGDKPSEVTSCSAPDQSSLGTDMPISDAPKVIRLADLFTAAQGKPICRKNETLTCEESSDSKVELACDFERKHELRGLLDRIKELAKEPQQIRSLERVVPNSSHNTNQLSKDQGHGNERGIMLESLKLLDPNEGKKTPGEAGIHKNINKVELNGKQAKSKEPYISNLVMKDGKGKKGESNGRIFCNGTNKLHKNKELVEDPFAILFDSQVERKDESGSDSDFAAFDYPRSESSSQVPLSGKRTNHGLLLYTEKSKYRNNLLLKFLKKSAKEKDISLAFGDCGPIAEIRILPSRKDNKFNYAYIVFKTEEGLRKALYTTDAIVDGSDVIVESISPLRKMPNRMLSLDKVGELDIPMALLQNPSRTVMIQGLPRDLTSHHLRHSLSFCGHISGFTMGSSSSVAYVEFETEDGKEKALLASSISISGKLLPILRIDSPITTIVRISNINPKTGGPKIHTICSSYGQVKREISRSTGIYDVHFKLTEWANMRNILNSLNGLVINEHRWIAQPATVIPPEILQILWSNPDSRQLVHSLFLNLCRKIEGSPIHTGELTSLVPEYYGEKE